MKLAAQWLLLALVVIAASVKSYSLYATTLDDRELTPAVIAAGQAHAPNQYRLLVPRLWNALCTFGVRPATAEQVIVVVSMVFAYSALALAFYRVSRSIPVTALCILAFYGAAASGFWFRYRDTFFEVGFVCLGITLVLEKRPSWIAYALLSAVATLNRETWLFSLAGAAALRAVDTADAGAGQRRRDVVGLVVASAITVGVLVAVRALYGVREYHYALWQYGNNVRLLVPLGSLGAFLPGAVWVAGSGAFATWLIFAFAGRARHPAFVIGYTGSLLVVSFFTSNWYETRIFIPAYAVMLVSVAGGLTQPASDATRLAR